MWVAIALAVVLVAGLGVGIAYRMGARSGPKRQARRAETSAVTTPRPREAPPPEPDSALPNVPIEPLFDATRFEPRARRAAATVVKEPVLNLLVASGVTPDGRVDLRNPSHQVTYTYRAGADDGCAYVRVNQDNHQVWFHVAEACQASKLGPPRCSLGEVVRKAQTGMSAPAAATLVLKYGPDLHGKPTWAASWGDALSVGGIPDDCGPDR